jgi:hypothetical protein
VILACNSTSSDRAVGVEVKDLSPEAVKPPPPPPPTTRKRQLRVTGFAWVSWDQVVQYDGIAWGSRWLEWGTQSYDLPIPDGGSFSLKVREARYDMTISAELNASQVVWLKMQGRSIPGMPIKEFWEFELRGLPVVPGDPTLYQAAASPLVSVVPKDVARFVTKATYERVFPDGTRQVLSNANWNHRTGPWATLPESPNAQCSFVSVKIQ